MTAIRTTCAPCAGKGSTQTLDPESLVIRWEVCTYCGGSASRIVELDLGPVVGGRMVGA